MQASACAQRTYLRSDLGMRVNAQEGDFMTQMRRTVVFCTAATAFVCLLTSQGFAQHDPGVRGGLNNTGGGLQAQGIQIPHPPEISPNPTTGQPIRPNEHLSFM